MSAHAGDRQPLEKGRESAGEGSFPSADLMAIRAPRAEIPQTAASHVSDFAISESGGITFLANHARENGQPPAPAGERTPDVGKRAPLSAQAGDRTPESGNRARQSATAGDRTAEASNRAPQSAKAEERRPQSAEGADRTRHREMGVQPGGGKSDELPGDASKDKTREYLKDPRHRDEQFKYGSLFTGDKRVLTISDNDHSGTAVKDEFIKHAKELRESGVKDTFVEGIPGDEKTQKMIDDYQKLKRSDPDWQKQRDAVEKQLASTSPFAIYPEAQKKMMDMIDAASEQGIRIHGTEPDGLEATYTHEGREVFGKGLRGLARTDQKSLDAFFDPQSKAEDVKKARAEIMGKLRETMSDKELETFGDFLDKGRSSGLDLRSLGGKSTESGKDKDGKEVPSDADQAFSKALGDWRQHAWGDSIAKTLAADPTARVAVFAGGDHFADALKIRGGPGCDSETFTDRLQKMGYGSVSVAYTGGDIGAGPEGVGYQSTQLGKETEAARGKDGQYDFSRERFAYYRSGPREADVTIHLPE